jgi:hypothetical protein
MRWLGLLLLVACAGEGGPRVRVDGRSVWLEAEAPVRGVELELAWDEGVQVTSVEAGADVARLDLVRARLSEDGRSARVVISDTRGVAVPARAELVHVVGTGTGTLRVVGVRVAWVSR